MGISPNTQHGSHHAYTLFLLKTTEKNKIESKTSDSALQGLEQMSEAQSTLVFNSGQHTVSFIVPHHFLTVSSKKKYGSLGLKKNLTVPKCRKQNPFTFYPCLTVYCYILQ